MTGATLAVRSRGLLGPLLPPFLALAVALALTASEPGVAVGITAAFALDRRRHRLCCVPTFPAVSEQTIVARGTQPAARRWDWVSRGAAGLAMAIAVSAAGLGGAAAFSSADPAPRFDPRTLIHQPPIVVSGVNPLATVEAQLHTRRRNARSSVSGSAPGVPIDRPATGSGWSAWTATTGRSGRPPICSSQSGRRCRSQ